MTNAEIIYGEIIANGIMTEEELENYLVEHMDIPPYKTFAEWKYLGYKIKKGSKAVIKTKLWKRVSTKEEKDNEVSIIKKFILVNASLFSLDQVEKIA